MYQSWNAKNEELEPAWPALTPLAPQLPPAIKQRQQTEAIHHGKLKSSSHGRSSIPQQTLARTEYPEYVAAFKTQARDTAKSLHIAPSDKSSANRSSYAKQPHHHGPPVTTPAPSYIHPQQGNSARWNAASSGYVSVPITLTPDYVEAMGMLLQSSKELEPHGYIFKALSRGELERKSQRCGRCLKSLAGRKEPTRFEQKPNITINASGKLQTTNDDVVSSKHRLSETDLDKAAYLGAKDATEKYRTATKAPTAVAEAKPAVCRSHPGVIMRGFPKLWSCCNNKLGSPACTGFDVHEPVAFTVKEVEQNWTFHPTPPYTFTQPDVLSGHRYAVAIDCEMGLSATGENELIRVTVVDHVTGAVLLDKLVWPDAPMQQYNTRFTGITARDMNEARRRRTCLMGREAARRAVWQFVGPQTIVCLHSGQNDFTTLRWIHHRIIDTFVLEPVPIVAMPEGTKEPALTTSNDAEDGVDEVMNEERMKPAEVANPEGSTMSVQSTPADQPKQKKKKGSGARSLQTLARVKLGRDIQKKEHDSIEDAVATRDLVHWAVMNKLDKST